MRTLSTCLLALCTVPLCTPGNARTPTGETDKIQQSLFQLTNEFRKTEGKKPFKLSDKLVRAAQKHADNMARQDKFGDDNKNGHVLDGKSVRDRTKVEGYPSALVGENVLFNRAGDDPSDKAIEGWKKSPPHRANMLGSYVEIGVGAAKSASGRWYVVQVFGSPTGSATAFKVTLENKSKAAVGVGFKNSSSVIPIAAGQKQTIQTILDVKELALEIRTLNAKTEPTTVTVGNGKTYVITGNADQGFKATEK